VSDLVSDPAGAIAALLWKLPALLIAVTLHELAHAITADRLGDPTPRRAGRITLNPLPHIDPLGAIAFVVAGFGWARPVPVSAANLRHPARDMALVAGAGPLTNFVVAFLALLLLVTVRRMLVDTAVTGGLARVLLTTFQFNLALGIFNLLPLPPLDGGHFLAALGFAGRWQATLEQYGPVLLLLLVVSGATRFVIGPVFEVMTGLYLALLRLVF
jgi:Zn-dependent protease